MISIATILAVCTVFGYAAAKSKAGIDRDCDLSDIELLGKYVFFDKISSPKRMACVTCHDPATGGTGSVSGVNLHQVAITGANPHTVGNLKPPTNAYASLIERLSLCAFGFPGMCGGNFWNGRSEGNEFPPLYGATRHIGEEIFFDGSGDLRSDPDIKEYELYIGPTADQALNPMPNPVEQNIERQAVCRHVESSKYASLYNKVWGVPIDCSDSPAVTHQAADVLAVGEEEYPFDISFKRLMLAVAAWQASPDLNSFSSKRDWALQRELDGIDVDDTPGEFPLVGLTDEENLGHDLFYNTVPFPFLPIGEVEFPPNTGNTVQNYPPNRDLPAANCSFCHSDNPGIFNPFIPGPIVAPDTGAEPEQLYADDAYHNIGTPRNPEIPDTGVDPDLGLFGLTDNPLHLGFHKTPTIRNVDKRKGKGFTKAYSHNGWFKSLESIVHFYNTAFLGGPVPPGPPIPYEDTTAYAFGITTCPPGIETEKDALNNNCWPEPAYSGPGTALGAILGNLHLTLEQEAAIVAYMKTLTDEHTAKAPKPYKPGD
jgi:cytochrome c peroxidase